MSIPRIAALEPPFTPAVTAELDRIMPPGVPPLALFRTWAVNERVFLRVMAAGLLDRGSISLRERELVIQRTCARLGSEYEWGVHTTFFAAKAGLDDAALAATCAADGAAIGLAPQEQLLFALVDALHWSAPQLVELVALVGFYHLVAFTTNAFRVPLEPFAARFAQPALARSEDTARGTGPDAS
jgi:alkylhydroperoxidase family enzyme